MFPTKDHIAAIGATAFGATTLWTRYSEERAAAANRVKTAAAQNGDAVREGLVADGASFLSTLESARKDAYGDGVFSITSPVMDAARTILLLVLAVAATIFTPLAGVAIWTKVTELPAPTTADYVVSALFVLAFLGVGIAFAKLACLMTVEIRNAFLAFRETRRLGFHPVVNSAATAHANTIVGVGARAVYFHEPRDHDVKVVFREAIASARIERRKDISLLNIYAFDGSRIATVSGVADDETGTTVDLEQLAVRIMGDPAVETSVERMV